jgi:hypothetical protein
LEGIQLYEAVIELQIFRSTEKQIKTLEKEKIRLLV